MKENQRWKRLAAWFLTFSMVFSNSSFAALSEELPEIAVMEEAAVNEVSQAGDVQDDILLADEDATGESEQTSEETLSDVGIELTDISIVSGDEAESESESESETERESESESENESETGSGSESETESEIELAVDLIEEFVSETEMTGTQNQPEETDTSDDSGVEMEIMTESESERDPESDAAQAEESEPEPETESESWSDPESEIESGFWSESEPESESESWSDPETEMESVSCNEAESELILTEMADGEVQPLLDVSAEETFSVEGLTFLVTGEGKAACTGYEGTMPEGELTIPSTVLDEAGNNYSVTQINSSAFKDCTQLHRVSLPENLISIGWWAFQGCSSLEEIVFPESVSTLGVNAFKNCTGLTQIKIPVNLSSCGESVFSGCTGITALDLTGNCSSLGNHMFYGCTGITILTIPENISQVGANAFDSCKGLTELTLVNPEINLSQNSFHNCTSLSLVTASGGNLGYGLGYGNENTCTSLKKIVVAEGTESIPSMMFDGLSQLEEVVIPEGVKSIGLNAFRKCTGLAGLALPASLESVTGGAFYGCSDLVLLVPIDSWAEQYAEENGFRYTYINVKQSALKVSVEGTETDGFLYAGSTLILQDQDGKQISSARIAGEETCTFYGLSIGKTYHITMMGIYGEELGVSEDIQIADGDNEITVVPERILKQVELQLVDPEGTDVTDQARISWYDTNNTVISVGKKIDSVPVGKTLRWSAELGKNLGGRYRRPEDQTVTVTEEETVFRSQLTAYAVAEAELHVTDSLTGKNLQGVSAELIQKKNGMYSDAVSATTNAKGIAKLSVCDTDYTLSISKNGYIPLTLSGSAGEFPREIAMTPAEGESVRFSFRYYQAKLNGEEQQTDADKEDISVSVYDITQEREVTDLLWQYPEMLLPSGMPAGDRLRVTFSSVSDDFSPVSMEIVTGEETSEDLPVELYQHGGVKITADTNLNDETVAIIFDETGTCVSSSRFSYKSVTFTGLKEGTYTAVLMGYHPSVREVARLDMLDGLGLASGRDYINLAVEISPALISEQTVDEVPVMDQECFQCFEEAEVSVGKTSFAAGNYTTVKASAKLKSDYVSAEDFSWMFTLPEGCGCINGTVRVGKNNAGYTIENGMLVLPVQNPEEIVRFCMEGTKKGEYVVNAFLRFCLDGEYITLPVDSALFSVTGLEFYIPEKTGRQVVQVRGTASAQAMVMVYDGDQCIAKTQANGSGEWVTDADLGEVTCTTYHAVHVETISALGTRAKSDMQIVKQSPTQIELVSVTMINTAHPANSTTPVEYETVFDYTSNTLSKISYGYWPSYPDFTYVIRFTENDPERISYVKLYVKLSDGTYRTLYPVYLDSLGAWTVTDQYTSADQTPVQVGVAFDADEEYVEKEYTDVEPDLSWLDEQIDEEKTGVTDTLDGATLFLDYTYDGKTYMTQTVTASTLTAEEWKSRKGDFTLESQEDGITTYGLVRDTDTGMVDEQVFEDGNTVFMMRTEYTSDIIKQANEIMQLLEDPVWNKVAEDTSYICNYYKWERIKEELSRPVGGAEDPPSDVPYVHTIKELPEAVSSRYDEIKEVYDDFEDIVWEKWNNWFDGVPKEFFDAGLLILGFVPGWDLVSLLGPAIYGGELARKGIALSGDVGQLDCISNVEKAGLNAQIGVGVLFGTLLNLGGSTVNAAAGAMDLAGRGWDGAAAGIRNVIGKANSGSISQEYIYAHYKERSKKTQKGKIRKMAEWLRNRATLGGETFMRQIFDDLNDAIKERCPNPRTNSPVAGSIQDPSGYVYEAVASNLLEGVIATCYEKVTKYDTYDVPYEEKVLWDAAEYGQVNPQVTGADGEYGWDVPAGRWQVKYEKEGYETAYSEWMDVPPPQMEVNEGLVSYEQPVVTHAMAYSDCVELSFSKYMRVKSLNTATIQVEVNGQPATGVITLPDQEVNPKKEGEYFASQAVFTFDVPVDPEGTVTVRVTDNARSYAGTALKAFESEALTVQVKPESIDSDKELSLVTGESGEVIVRAIPQEAAAGKKLIISSVTRSLFTVNETEVTLDEAGSAVVHVTANMPGTSEIIFEMDGTDLRCSTLVSVSVPAQDQTNVATPKASVENEATIHADTEITLSCDTEGAVIYYTLDGSCPCTEETRLRYTGPIRITKTCRLLTMAEKEGMEDSAVGKYSLTVTDHEYSETITEPTCTKPGTKVRICSYCNKKEEETIPAKGHSYGSTYTTDLAPTCTTPGSKSKYCTKCGAKTSVTSIPAPGHSWDSGKKTKAETCTSAGEKIYTCTRTGCGATKMERVEATGHSYSSSYTTDTAATCTTAGVKTFTCTRTGCGEKKTETVTAAGHRLTHHAAVAATCTAGGNAEYWSCSTCGKNFSDAAGTKEIGNPATAALGHTWSTWKTTADATALSPKKQARTCSVCKQKDTRTTGKKLKATMTLTASSLKMKVKQSTTAFKVSKMAKGDSLKSVKSSNTKILKVSNVKSAGTFKLTAQNKTGTATLTITLKSGMKKTVKVTVQKDTVKTTKITVPSSKVSLKKGKKVTLSPVVTPVTSQQKITYKSSNTKIATVSSKGVITAKKKGTAKIAVTSGSKKTTVTVTVK